MVSSLMVGPVLIPDGGPKLVEIVPDTTCPFAGKQVGQATGGIATDGPLVIGGVGKPAIGVAGLALDVALICGIPST